MPEAISTMELKPYPEYKDSGIDWIGDIPKRWQVMPGRACFYEKNEPNTGLKEKTVLSLSYGKIVVKPEEKLHGLVPASFETYQVIDPGDIVIRPTDLQNDWNSLRFGLAENRGIITSAYLCFQTTEMMNSKYGHLLLHTYDLNKVFYGLGSGLRQNLDWTDFKYLPCLVPPLPEQEKIVRYHRWIEQQLLKLINAKRRLIELLNEQKQVIISRAVTRGLDPNVQFKPSGIEWLGDLPEHWEIIRLKYLLKDSLKYGASVAAELTDPNLPRYIRITDIDKNGMLLEKTFKSLPEKKAEPYLLEDGDILLARSGATVGKSFLYSESYGRACHAGYLIRARLNKKIIRPKFLYAFLNSFQYWQWINSMTIQATIQNVNAEKYANLQIILPKIDEQDQILGEIARSTGPIESILRETYHEIDLFHEYRCRIISDIITGKADVRNIEISDENPVNHKIDGISSPEGS